MQGEPSGCAETDLDPSCPAWIVNAVQLKGRPGHPSGDAIRKRHAEQSLVSISLCSQFVRQGCVEASQMWVLRRELHRNIFMLLFQIRQMFREHLSK